MYYHLYNNKRLENLVIFPWESLELIILDYPQQLESCAKAFSSPLTIRWKKSCGIMSVSANNVCLGDAGLRKRIHKHPLNRRPSVTYVHYVYEEKSETEQRIFRLPFVYLFRQRWHSTMKRPCLGFVYQFNKIPFSLVVFSNLSLEWFSWKTLDTIDNYERTLFNLHTYFDGLINYRFSLTLPFSSFFNVKVLRFQAFPREERCQGCKHRHPQPFYILSITKHQAYAIFFTIHWFI